MCLSFSCVYTAAFIWAVFPISLLFSAKKKKKTFLHNTEGIMIREFLYREDEVCLLVRREDSFPVATVGNTEGLFGITDEAFSRDDTELFRAMKEPEKGYAFFRKYGVWDGKTPLSAEIEMKNVKMTTLTAVRCHDDNFNEDMVPAKPNCDDGTNDSVVIPKPPFDGKTYLYYGLTVNPRTIYNALETYVQGVDNRQYIWDSDDF